MSQHHAGRLAWLAGIGAASLILGFTVPGEAARSLFPLAPHLSPSTTLPPAASPLPVHAVIPASRRVAGPIIDSIILAAPHQVLIYWDHTGAPSGADIEYCAYFNGSPTWYTCGLNHTLPSYDALGALALNQLYDIRAWYVVGGVNSDTTEVLSAFENSLGTFTLDDCYSYPYGGKIYNDVSLSWSLNPYRSWTNWEVYSGYTSDTTYAYLEGSNTSATSSMIWTVRVDNAAPPTYLWVKTTSVWGDSPFIPLDVFPMSVPEDPPYTCSEIQERRPPSAHDESPFPTPMELLHASRAR